MPATHLLLGAILLAVAAFAVGIAIYVVASFLLMRPHTARRGIVAAAREAMREAWWVVLTQPLLPLWYLIGRRMGGGSGGVPVVFVHGYMQNRINFVRLARALRGTGSGALFGFNYPWWRSVPSNAAALARFVESVRRETGAVSVDLVCHSLGGLVAMEYLRGAGATHVRRCVTIATPHAGIAWQGPILGACGDSLRPGAAFLDAHARIALEVPCLSVYSTHDNVVHPPETSTLAHRGGRDLVVANRSHLALLFAPDVIAEVVGFLGDGDPHGATPRRTAALSA